MYYLHLLKFFSPSTIYIFGRLIHFLKLYMWLSGDVIPGMISDDLLVVSANKENKNVMGITKRKSYLAFDGFLSRNKKKGFNLDQYSCSIAVIINGYIINIYDM